MPITTESVTLAAGGAASLLATGSADPVEVRVTTALADAFIGGSTVAAAEGYPVAANTHVAITLKQGDLLYGSSVTGGEIKVLRTRQ